MLRANSHRAVSKVRVYLEGVLFRVVHINCFFFFHFNAASAAGIRSASIIQSRLSLLCFSLTSSASEGMKKIWAMTSLS